MGYVSRGKRPFEYASKSSHSFIIREPGIQAFLNRCNMPYSADKVTLPHEKIVDITVTSNPIRYVIAIDGGYTEVVIQPKYPSSRITFFQFGALVFSIEDLKGLEQKPFIDPEDIAKLKNIQRFKFVLPSKNISFDGETLLRSVRKSLFEFFIQQPDLKESFAESLKWFIFQEYDKKKDYWVLATCPNSECNAKRIKIYASQLSRYETKCPRCNAKIFLTDIFRFHEVVDDELGAGGICGYLMNVFEHMALIHLIRVILQTKPSLLNQILFLKDGPLAFFGQSANLHKPMRALVKYLNRHQDIFMAGLEKSGVFVEHADEVSSKLTPNQALMLSNDYIYRYIIPGKADSDNPYGRTTYYGNKVIYKAGDDRIYVVTVPTPKVVSNPTINEFINLEVVLCNVQNLKCDMYDSSLIPIALVNKLVSLANHPSSAILEKFAKKTINLG